jgi:hypothetical protein
MLRFADALVFDGIRAAPAQSSPTSLEKIGGKMPRFIAHDHRVEIQIIGMPN